MPDISHANALKGAGLREAVQERRAAVAALAASMSTWCALMTAAEGAGFYFVVDSNSIMRVII